MKSAAIALLLPLAGCAGQAAYSVRPFYEEHLQRMVCCEAMASNSKDIASLSFDLATQPEGIVTVHFSESGVGATAPIQANTAAVSAVAGAVTATANAASKFSLKP
ncbi:hypothetical protein RSP822_18345 [Ralstonia solanacearum]|nr:hypothetical protein RSP822_18345 [Ralstonia solanacearum]